MAASELSINAKTGSPDGEPVYLVVGLLRRPHGVHGEIMVEIITNFPERLKAGEKFYVGDERVSVTVATSRKHNKGILLSFEGIGDRDAIGAYRNQYLYVDLNTWPPLPEGEFYDFELLGLEVIVEETGEVLGKLIDILETGANDVYVVESDSGQEYLLPAIPEVVLDIDLDTEQMKVYLLPGLLDDKN
jgi:16S rRNA processing protein RimM